MQPQRNPRFTIAHACLGRTIEDLRIRRGVSQHELGARAEANRRYIAALENGNINPPFHTLLRLAYGLDVTLPELFALYQRHFETYPGRPAQSEPLAAAGA